MLLHVVTGLLLAATAEPSAAGTTPEMVKGKKICMTAKQWQKASDANRDEFESRTSSGGHSGT